MDENGHKQVPILVGTGTGSAKETVKLCKEAKEAGADYAIVIFPGYFAFAIGKNKAAVNKFFVHVLDHSAIPVMASLQNYSVAVRRLNIEVLNSDLQLSRRSIRR